MKCFYDNICGLFFGEYKTCAYCVCSAVVRYNNMVNVDVILQPIEFGPNWWKKFLLCSLASFYIFFWIYILRVKNKVKIISISNASSQREMRLFDDQCHWLILCRWFGPFNMAINFRNGLENRWYGGWWKGWRQIIIIITNPMKRCNDISC